ncbi:MAG: adenylate/guanylate cyclase domain-containing protein, partial [Bacteroidota bacterium]|nr:adenylate/guanylate cyclase domain-containing protein [Bacteroidota bacterium]
LKLSEAKKEVKFQKQRIDTHIDELNKLSLIVKKTDNTVLIINPDGDIEWANEAFSRMYGLSFEDFTNRYGININDISFNKKRALNRFNNLINEKKSVSYISYVRGFNTIGEKWIHTTLTPIFDDYQNIDKIVAIETDISTSKKYERSLEVKNKEMSDLTVTLKKTNEELEKQKELIQDEREKTETLLENILPRHVASQLKNIGSAKPRNYKLASIMFTDFKGFTKLCEHLKPEEIVNHLDKFFSVYDDIVMDNYLEKIKTIGDAYMCVGGIPVRNRSNPFNVVIAALEIQDFMNNLNKYDPNNEIPRWKIRLGIHTGPIVAGVVGKIKFAYDVWGDSVNIASRMESKGKEGKINVSGATYELIKDYFECEFRGEIEIKNRGKMAMYFVNRLKHKYSKDKKGVKPNEEFAKFLHSL